MVFGDAHPDLVVMETDWNNGAELAATIVAVAGVLERQLRQASTANGTSMRKAGGAAGRPAAKHPAPREARRPEG